jgi:hypothetical protein
MDEKSSRADGDLMWGFVGAWVDDGDVFRQAMEE